MTKNPQKQPINHLRRSKKPLAFLLCLFVVGFGYGQNLVPNPSFEDYTVCPDADGQISYASNWANYSGTSDYFNSCSTFPYPSVPTNVGGYQAPATGEAYAGIYTYGLREVFGCQLSSSLNEGTLYYISYKVNLVFNPDNSINYGAIDKIGLLFSEAFLPPSITDTFMLNNFAHACTENIVNDTMNWVVINSTFVADSNYQYLYIGNFFDDAHTDTLTSYQNNVPGYPNYKCSFSYYFIDDIYVSDQPLSINENKKNDLLIYPKITNSKFSITSSSNPIEHIIITNCTGEQVYENKEQLSKIEIDASFLSQGIYFINVIVDNKIYKEKIIIN